MDDDRRIRWAPMLDETNARGIVGDELLDDLGWRHRALNGRGDELARYVAAWPTTRTSRDRVLLLEGVVHALHVASRDDMPGNLAARNFLEGSRPRIVAFLDELAHGPGSKASVRARVRRQTARDHHATHGRSHLRPARAGA